MARITFKGKPITVYNADNTVAYRTIKIPVFARNHCDMAAFRKHPKYGGIANSDLFPNALARIRRDVFGNREDLRLDRMPEGVSVDLSGFLTVITIDV